MKKISLMLVVLFAFAVLTCTSGVASAYDSYLKTKYVGNTIVDLSWGQYEYSFSKYEICRDGVPIATITNRSVTFYRDTGLTKGNAYEYWKRVYSATGTLVDNETISATTGEVHGTITLDTTWTAGPYDLTDFVFVRNGATLTIVGGVLVNTSLKILSADEKGALYADGASFSGCLISVHDDAHAEIKNCFIDYGDIGLYNSSNNVITGNTLSNAKLFSGINLRSSSNNLITGNTVSNNGWNGISLRDNSSNNLITDNTVSNNSWFSGIILDNSSNNLITGNTVSNNANSDGIEVGDYSSNNTFTDNTVSNNGWNGITLDDYSSNNTFTDNTVSNNGRNGITLDDYSSNNTFTDNTVSNNKCNGIRLQDNSSNNLITDNTVSNNGWNGITLDDYSSNNTFTDNTVSNNGWNGITLDDYSSNNTIYNNYFNNTKNAYDSGNNTWNIPKTAGSNIVGGPYLGGNYWSDYKGTDLDGDKLGDTLLPHNCSGGIENGGDHHPLIIIPKIILKASKDGYASVQHEVDNDENFGQIEISGNVTDELTTGPIEGAKVEIVKGADPASTTTDADGFYTITVIIPDGSGRDTREDVNFELPPAEYIITAETFTAEIQQAIEDNDGTVLETFDVPDGSAVLILVNVSKEEKIETFLENVGAVSGVRYIDPNLVGEVSYIPNDPGYPSQWGPRRIQAGGLPNPSAWDWEQGNKNVTIAILDTGVDYNHRDLKPNYKIGGYDWVNDDNDPMDDRVSLHGGHGTHVAGIAAAVIDNNTAVAGIAQCNIVSEKMANEWGTFTVFDEVKAIYDASMQNADVLSMSFRNWVWNGTPIKAEEAAIQYAWLKGCILVAASGNDGGPWVREDVKEEDVPVVYPASYEDVIAVGAIDQNDNLWVGSNWGPEQELVAPGVDILSTRVGGGTTYMTGTSMAVPHVSGVAALLKSHAKQFPPEPLATDPWYHLNNKQIRTIMQRTTEDLGPVGRDQIFGYGLVDAESALRCVNIRGNVLESVFNVPIPHPPNAPFPPEVRVTSIEGPPGIYTTNENTWLARITLEGDYHVRVPPGVYSICAMAYGYIPSRGLGGERIELPAFDFLGNLNTDYRELRLVPFPCNVTGNVTDSATGLPIKGASVSLDGPPHIYPPHPNVHMDTDTDSSGNYSFILEYGVHPPYPTGEAVYDISVGKQGYDAQTQNFTLNWSDVITDYYKCRLSPLDYNPPIVNFSLLPVPSELPSVPSELPDLTLTSNDIRAIFNENATVSATVHNIGTADASNIIVQFFDGDPNAGGVQIGSDQIISRIPAGGVGTAQVTWIAIPGTHDIFVRVDPYDSIQEVSENNNQAHKPITIEPTYDQPPIASFTYSPLNPVANETITFNASNSSDSDGFIVNYEWGFGDELNKTGEAVTHAYASPGNYNVILSVTDNDGAVDTETKGITVSGVKTIYVDDDFADDPANHRWDTIQEGITDANDGDTVLVYNGTYTENIVLNKTITLTGEGMPMIDAHSLGDAINITTDNCTVKGFCCVNAQPSPYAGIHVESGNNVIEDNTCKDNYMGIYLSGSLNKIRNNIANYNHADGIGLGTSSDNNTIVNNTAKNNGNNGIYLKESNNNKIANNIANSNKFDGIRLRSNSNNIVTNNMANSNKEAGILCLTSSDNILTYNNLSSNSFGLWLHNYSSENIVANNTANSNYYYAIHVRWSSNNNIYLNNFIANIYNAYSYNSSNIWHSKSKITYTYNSQIHTNFMGNFWSDYNGSDADGDGIGEDPYSIDGDKDYYPLMERFENLA